MSEITKKMVVRIPKELHDEVCMVAEDREVTFPDALAAVLRAGVSRVRALDRHALVKSGHLKPHKATPKKKPRAKAR